jgi:hypothetical protein
MSSTRLTKLAVLFVFLALSPACHAAFSAPGTQICYGNVTAGTSTFCSLPVNPTTGNLVVATIITFSGLTAGACSVQDGASNCYSTPVCSSTHDGTAGTACLSYFVATGTANKTVTLTVTGGTCGACSIRVDEFAVSGGTASIDGSVQTGTGTTQAVTAPTVTPTGSGRLLVAMCADGDRCGTVGGSWVEEANSPGSFAESTAYQLSASSATAASWAGTSTADWDTVVAAFKITGGGGGGSSVTRKIISD